MQLMLNSYWFFSKEGRWLPSPPPCACSLGTDFLTISSYSGFSSIDLISVTFVLVSPLESL